MSLITTLFPLKVLVFRIDTFEMEIAKQLDESIIACAVALEDRAFIGCYGIIKVELMCVCVCVYVCGEVCGCYIASETNLSQQHLKLEIYIVVYLYQSMCRIVYVEEATG